MPIIPRYHLNQTSTHVHIEVSIPHVRVSPSSLDLVIVDGTELHLHCPPTYLLKLMLPETVISEDAVEDSLANAVSAGTAVVEIDANCNQIGDCTGSDPAKTAPIWTKNDLPKLKYNPEKNHGTLVVILRKEAEGFWKDLDLLGRLQQPTHQSQGKNLPTNERTGTHHPLVQEVDATENVNEKSEQNEHYKSEVMDDLLDINQSSPAYGYGLFQRYSNVFRDYAREGLAHEMLECPNPDGISSVETENDTAFAQQNRREMRLLMENEKFDQDRYLDDLNIEQEGDMIFDAAMTMVPHWSQSNEDLTDQLSRLSTLENPCSFFSSWESHLLANIPAQNMDPAQLTGEQNRSSFLSLADILFAYAYDHRTTDGDPTVESSWTVMILSPCLAWLENYNAPYDGIVDVMRWSIRRSLIYPYLRSYTMAMKILADVCHILQRGRRTVIRCLLQLHKIIEKSERHYLFNKLYIDPLIGWVQQCEESDVKKFGSEISDLFIRTNQSSDANKYPNAIGKGNLELGLVELERALVCNDEGNSTSSEEEDNGYFGDETRNR